MTTRQFTLPERNGLVYKPHPRFLAQNFSKKVRIIHESLRYALLMKIFCIYMYNVRRENDLASLKDAVVKCLLLPPQGFGPEAKTRGGIIVSPAYTYGECVNIGVVCL